MNDKEYGMDGVQPVNPFYEDTLSPNQSYAEMQSPVQVPQESVKEDRISYTEMSTKDSTMGVSTSMDDEINENPNAKISLRSSYEEVAPVSSNITEEKIDKETIWILIGLFVGLLAVIIALPYIYEIFKL